MKKEYRIVGEYGQWGGSYSDDMLAAAQADLEWVRNRNPQRTYHLQSREVTDWVIDEPLQIVQR